MNGHYQLTCEQCGKSFHRDNKQKYKRRVNEFCSVKCFAVHQTTAIEKPCGNCGKITTRVLAEYKNSKSGNIFCNSSCAATYNNTHKKTGTRISKLEVWLASELTKIYPNLVFQFNQKDAINSELDIFIPTLKLAFELNGIFHYEPIFGEQKLTQIQNNDQRKFQACFERGIELCIIDASTLMHFKIHKAEKYLKIITDIIDQKYSVVK